MPATEATSRRFWVSVPVLSVMIRSTAPRTSSAFRRRTRTPRRRSRYAPRPRMTASRTGGSSGIAAIAAEIPASRLSPGGLPRTKPSPVVIAISPIATTSRIRTSRSSSSWSGDRRRSRVARPPAIRPTSVPGAGRDDDALAAAADHARARVGHRPPIGQRRRRRVGGGRRGLGHGLAGQDAPVERRGGRPGQPEVGRDDVADPQQDDVARARASAAGTSTTRPSRRTRARGADASRSASSARSPRYSVTTSAPTIGMSPARTSEPSRTSPSEDRADAGREQQEDERLGRGLQDHPPHAGSLRRLDLIRARDLRAPEHGLFGQPDGRIDVQRPGSFGRRDREPGREVLEPGVGQRGHGCLQEIITAPPGRRGSARPGIAAQAATTPACGVDVVLGALPAKAARQATRNAAPAPARPTRKPTTGMTLTMPITTRPIVAATSGCDASVRPRRPGTAPSRRYGPRPRPIPRTRAWAARPTVRPGRQGYPRR